MLIRSRQGLHGKEVEMPSKLQITNLSLALSIILTVFLLTTTIMIAFTMNGYIHHSRGGVNAGLDETTDLQGNHSYKVQVTLTDNDPDNAEVQGSMEVYVDGVLVELRSLSDYDWPDADENARATDTESMWLYPESDCQLRIVIRMDTGDDWSYVLFEDLPEELEQQGLFYGITSVLGIVLILVLFLIHLHYYEKSYFAQHRQGEVPTDIDGCNEYSDESIGVEFYD
jgi:hypothetical protein